ncbi:MAG: hypothetical protein SVU69_02445 [Pseudomonadota bacterium]|nr:hypothetical protein [Pseudomonadota bacterium]
MVESSDHRAEPRQLKDWDEVRQSYCHLVGLAKRELRIFSPALEPGVFEQRAFMEAVRTFLITAHARRIHLLVLDGATALRKSPRLVELLRSFPSQVEIRRLGPHIQSDGASYLLADEDRMVLRSDPKHYAGIVVDSDLGKVRPKRQEFVDYWAQSDPDPNLRRLQL